MGRPPDVTGIPCRRTASSARMVTADHDERGGVLDGSALVVAVPAAVLGAAGFGLASAAQQRATHEVERERTLDPRLLVHLAARPMWLLGLAATIGALALQLAALAFGPV